MRAVLIATFLSGISAIKVSPPHASLVAGNTDATVEGVDGWTIKEGLAKLKARSIKDLEGMSGDDRRNTMIVELNNRGKGSVGELQGSGNDQLMQKCPKKNFWEQCFLQNHYRTVEEMGNMSDDDKRNTLIVELNKIGQGSIGQLQGYSDFKLLHMCPANAGLGDCLLRNQYRGREDLAKMSEDDRRNTLIVELSKKGDGRIQWLQKFHSSTLVAACPPGDPSKTKGPCEECAAKVAHQNGQVECSYDDGKGGSCKECCDRVTNGVYDISLLLSNKTKADVQGWCSKCHK